MSRITEKERKEFHCLLDLALLKLDSDKNKDKCHWSKLSLTQLQKMIAIESKELDLATHNMDVKEMNTELDDIIILAIFKKHNLFKGV